MRHNASTILSVLCLLGCGLVGGVAHAATDASVADAGLEYETALQALEGGEKVEAAIFLKRGLRKDPQHIPSILLLGEVYLDNDLWQAAETAFRQALGFGADPARVYQLLARSLLAQHRARDLLNEFDATGAPPALAVEIHALRAEAYLSLGDFHGLGGELEQAEAIETGFYAIQLLRIPLLIHLGDLASAEVHAQNLISDFPYRTETWNAAASVAHARRSVPTALERYTRAVQLAPENGDARLGRLSLLIDSGRLDEVSADLEFFESEHPSEPRVNYFRSLYLAATGDAEGARNALSESVAIISQLHDKQLQGGNRALLIVAALGHYGLGQFESSIQQASAYLNQDPDNIGVIKLLSDAQIRTDRPAQALRQLKRAIEMQPEDPALYVLAATAMQQLQNFEAASEYLARALEISELAQLKTRQAAMEIGAGRVSVGTRILSTLLEASPASDTVVISLMVAHMRNGDHAGAVAVGERYARGVKDDNLTVQNLLGVAYANVGDLARARRVFLACAEQNPEFAPAVTNLARIYQAEGDNEAALAEIGKLLAVRPRSTVLLSELAQLQLAMGNERASLRNAEAAHRLSRDKAKSGKNYVEVLLATQSLNAADGLTRELERTFPQDPEIADLRLRYLLAAGDSAGVAKAAKVLFRASGINLSWLLRTAQYQSAAGLFQDAVSSLARARFHHPDSVQANLGLLETYLVAGRIEEATRELKTLPAGFFADSRFRLLRGEINFARGSLEEALRDFSSIDDATHASLSAIRSAHVLAMMGKFGQAKARLRTRTKAAPDDVKALETLADLHLSTNEFHDAAKRYQQVLQQTSSARVHNNLSVALEQTDQLNPAIEHARQAVDLDPQNASYEDTLGWALLRADDPEAALPHLREAITRDWTNAGIRLHLARCLKALGRQTEALSMLREGLAQSRSVGNEPGYMELLEALDP